nr:NUDIX domain-containing protein [Variovorax terrae]
MAALRAETCRPPVRARLPLLAGTAAIGSVEPDFLSQIGPMSRSGGRWVLQKEERSEGWAWCLQGDVTASLAQVAQALREAGLAQAWRDEQLAVPDAQGRVLGTVERGVVRPLGIATRAVHLVGQAPDGRIWVQQRSLSKANDPGRWDTLMGGMVSAGDTLESALARETWEEAGLALEALQALSWGGRVGIRRPSDRDEDPGYTVEEIDWYRCTVPDGLAPDNQDGEVAQFRLLAPRELALWLERDEFTAEAGLILAAALGH